MLVRSDQKSLWRRVLSENVFAEWEKQLEQRAGGSHRTVTIAFADLRGFTAMVDQAHQYVAQITRETNASPETANDFARREADESMATINRYLSEIARLFKEHDGTFDKYIGDCVMAFWGAPLPRESHALPCVLAAMAAQRRIKQLNDERKAENVRREQDNLVLAKSAQRPLRMLPLLSFGIGIHTGEVTVGTLGGGNIVSNYTVFGRDVNIASRLEGFAQGGQILISATTLREIERGTPILASRCRSLGSKLLKGIREPIEVFEVPWDDSEALSSVLPP
ncbi:MAG TPA: hypothetical protein DCE44_08405 [Verrucomicrobiales bacterium]|nr:hypothetical protein [Verrucomicrobiales bacterium]